MRKYALGIHHLNIAYSAGNEVTYHRQVRESVVPLLDLLSRHPNWCFTIEMCGFSIEFIAEKYPTVFSRFRELIYRNQIELISCTYSPQIWIAFPKSDMIKSIKLNIKVLEKYSLSSSRIFFSQENFSGEGLKTLSEWFDAFVIKDDYYQYLHKQPDSDNVPFLKLEETNVIVGGNHILEVVSSKLFSNESSKSSPRANYLLKENAEQLNRLKENIKNKEKLISPKGSWKDVEWLWYHIGSSERFAKPVNRPDSFSDCRFNPNWIYYLEKCLECIQDDGYQFSSVQKFIDDSSSSGFEPQECKPLLDGSWNMEKSKGGFLWMGFNASVHEDDLSVRTHNWRSRARLIAVESVLKENGKYLAFEKELEKAWKMQLLAESSDSTGWFPDKREVLYSVQQSEGVLNLVSQITNSLKLKWQNTIIVDTQKGILIPSFEEAILEMKEVSLEETYAQIHLVGAKGNCHLFLVDQNTQRMLIHLSPEEGICGINFNCTVDYLLFCPALMDNEAVRYKFSEFSPSKIYLPLPNGLICIAENLFLIKHNEYMNIACYINRETKKVGFEIENPPPYPINWVLTIFKGTLDEAILLADSINIHPVVFL